MGRIIFTSLIGLFFALDLALPYTPLGRRGSDAEIKLDEPSAVGRVGQVLPDLEFVDLDGAAVHLSDFRGHRVVLTFERSLDW